MNVLVTGGNGFIAGRVSHYLVKAGYDVFIGSRHLNNQIDSIPIKNIRVTDWDDIASIYKACENIDIVIHSVGMNASDSMVDPVGAFKVNGLATANLAKAAIKNKVQKFFYFSTIHVYSDCLNGLINESTCISNAHPYSTSHVAGENSLLWYHQNKEIDATIFRMSNVFGSPVNPGVNCWMLFVNNLCRQAVQTGYMEIESDSSTERNFLSVSNVCSITDYFISSINRAQNPIFNIGNLYTSTLLEFAKIIQERCEIILNFRPVIKCSTDASIISKRKLNFCVDKLLNYGYNFQDNTIKEIDLLLLNCNKWFS